AQHHVALAGLPGVPLTPAGLIPVHQAILCSSFLHSPPSPHGLAPPGNSISALAGLLASLPLLGSSLSNQTILFFGAGEAGTGMPSCWRPQSAERRTYPWRRLEAAFARGLQGAGDRNQQIGEHIPGRGSRVPLARGSKGLVVRSRVDSLQPHKVPFAHDHPESADLVETIHAIRPTALIGVSGQAGTFTQPVCEAMAQLNEVSSGDAFSEVVLVAVPGQAGTLFTQPVCEAMEQLNERPIVFALSNPTSLSECTAETRTSGLRCVNGLRWVDTWGRAIFASGRRMDGPFAPVEMDGRRFVPGQDNNAGSPFAPVEMDGRWLVLGLGNNACVFPQANFFASHSSTPPASGHIRQWQPVRPGSGHIRQWQPVRPSRNGWEAVRARAGKQCMFLAAAEALAAQVRAIEALAAQVRAIEALAAQVRAIEALAAQVSDDDREQRHVVPTHLGDLLSVSRVTYLSPVVYLHPHHLFRLTPNLQPTCMCVSQVSDGDREQGRVYPPIWKIRQISAHIARAVAAKAYDLATAPSSDNQDRCPAHSKATLSTAPSSGRQGRRQHTAKPPSVCDDEWVLSEPSFTSSSPLCTPLSRRQSFAGLPEDVWVKVLQMLKPADLPAVRGTCSSLYRLAVHARPSVFIHVPPKRPSDFPSFLARAGPALSALTILPTAQLPATCLALIGPHCPGLVTLNLTDQKGVTDAVLAGVGGGCVGLKTLKVKVHHGKLSQGLEAIAANCRMLETLSLPTQALKVTVHHGKLIQGLEALPANCRMLEMLSLPTQVKVHHGRLIQGPEALPANCRMLETLSLPTQIFHVGLASLAAHCPTLSFLRLNACHAISHIGLASLAAHCPALSSLRLNACHAVRPPHCLPILSRLPSLQSLDLGQSPLLADWVEGLLSQKEGVFGEKVILTLACPSLCRINFGTTSRILLSPTPSTTTTTYTTHHEQQQQRCQRPPWPSHHHTHLFLLSQTHPDTQKPKTPPNHAPPLESLVLPCFGMSDTVISAIASACPSLTSLRFDPGSKKRYAKILGMFQVAGALDIDCTVTDASLQSLAASCPSLSELHLFSDYLLGTAHPPRPPYPLFAITIPPHPPPRRPPSPSSSPLPSKPPYRFLSLKALSITSCSLADPGVACIVTACPNLLRLLLRDCIQLPPAPTSSNFCCAVAYRYAALSLATGKCHFQPSDNFSMGVTIPLPLPQGPFHL
ncbi:unnamed protein product, partial [Closterium sp. NIES-64]